MSPIRARAQLGATLLAALTALVVAPGALAQTNTCGAAAPVGPGTYSGTTDGATVDGASSCGDTGSAPDVWYRFDAADDCTLALTTCGSEYDTVLSIHTACPGSAANELVCNDDQACAATPLSSVVQVSATGGQTYYIRVCGWQGSSGNYTLAIACGTPPPPPTDTCALATVITPGDYSGTTSGANTDGSSSCGETGASPDVWYRVTPTEPCLLVANTCGSAYDTVLSIHTACPGSAANELDCSDDTGGNCAPTGLGSTVQTAAGPGQDYYLRVSGWSGASGAFLLHVECQPSAQADSCAGAIDIGAGTFFGDAASATPDGSSLCDRPGAPPPDVWYRYTPLEDCNLAISTCGGGGGADTLISVHTGCPGSTANQVGCNDDGCGAQSSVLVDATAGQPYYIRVATYSASGVFSLTLTCNPPQADGADIYVGELHQFNQYGRVGGTVGCALDSPLCNAGTQPLDWFANPDPRHPFAVFNLYRLTLRPDAPARFEQIGQSWAKHGFGAAQDNVCGFGCTPFPNGTRLGVGCSDSYDANLNGVQNILGPRHEINPWTGEYTYEGSHFDTPQPPHTPISHRLQLRDEDLDPSANPAALYIAEVYIVGHDDANHMNSVAHEEVNVSGAPGGTWNFNLSGNDTVNGVAIAAWQGATRTVIPDTLTTDGRSILAAQVTPVFGIPGLWHYEYALYNHDMDRAVQSFSVPIGGATITNIGFHAVPSHDEPYVNDPWGVTVSGGRITWATDLFLIGTLSNPVRWGTMYNFRFDADRPPVDSTATITPYKPGGPASFTGATQAPSGACPPDFNGDGTLNSQDFFDFLAAFFGGLPTADFNLDGLINSQDFFDFLAAFFGGC